MKHRFLEAVSSPSFWITLAAIVVAATLPRWSCSVNGSDPVELHGGCAPRW